MIASGDTAATAVIKMLEENGYDYTHTGDIQTEFYLSSISRADAFRGAAIEERLRRLIERDGITFLPDSGRDRLGEFDYTRGAGWMYFLNGEICPGKSMSDYMLNGGEHISLRFTLAFGKDVGASFADSNTSLSSYCGKWVNGTILEYEHDYREAERLEATREQPGYILYLCDQCKEEKKEILEYVPPEGGETPEERPPEGGEAPEEVPPEVPPEGGEGSEEVPPEVPPEGGDDIPTEGESDVSGNGN